MKHPNVQPSSADLWARFMAAAISGMATEGVRSEGKIHEAALIADGAMAEFQQRFRWDSNNGRWDIKAESPLYKRLPLG